jgi:hypothetical protein
LGQLGMAVKCANFRRPLLGPSKPLGQNAFEDEDDDDYEDACRTVLLAVSVASRKTVSA